MEQITIGQAQKHTSPNPITLVCTETPEGKANLAAVSWWTYLSNKPPMLGFAMSDKSYSGERIRATGKVVLSIPGADIAREAFQCGCMSGRDVDKADKLGLALTSLPETSIQFPSHSKLAFVCTLDSTARAGDHTIYICKVDAVHFSSEERQLFSWDGYAGLRPL